MNLSPADWLRLAEEEAAARKVSPAQVLAQWLAVANAGMSPGYLRLPPGQASSPRATPAVAPL